MHREVKEILNDMKGVSLATLVSVLKEKSPNISVDINTTLSLKQTVWVYEWYEKNGCDKKLPVSQRPRFVHKKVLPDTDYEPIPKSEREKERIRTDISVKLSLETKSKYNTRWKLVDDPNSLFRHVGLYDSETSKGPAPSKTKGKYSRFSSIRSAQVKLEEEKRRKDIGPNAKIIYTPQGGQNKKY